ncbi:uncharacterized protein [Procambarus clarkii]|uniref:uncharacterized protein n=1 Tax=Procambarus clarkii TaxID=6728 RepID=UPI001E67517E|nr:uncharacterized protein LOC123746844 [Procambarus clarkii]
MIFSMFLTLFLVAQAAGHMSLQEPPARNVMWRMGFNDLPAHADDDYLICHEKSARNKCPPCGDSADTPPPHPHEGGGQWATGIISRTYTMGQVMNIHVNVTRSHGGSIEFKLCPHDSIATPVDQRCLDRYPLEIVGSNSRSVPIRAPYNSPEQISVRVRLPPGVACDQCVLQMTNTAEEFKPQKIMFRNCADIAIEGNAKTNQAAGEPVGDPAFSISSRSGFGSGSGTSETGFTPQIQHRLFFPERR